MTLSPPLPDVANDRAVTVVVMGMILDMVLVMRAILMWVMGGAVM